MPAETPIAPLILVVDDDRTFGDAIGAWLSGSGYAVDVAGTGAEALACAARRPPDVVVTDLRMPHMDGLELLSAIKAYDPSIEVIFLSGQATLEIAVEALREGRGFDLLQKPLVNLNSLNRVIERALSRRRERAGAGVGAAVPVPPFSLSVEQTLAYVRANLRQRLLLRDVADALGYAANYLTDLVRRETGKTVQQWIILERLAAGGRLLRESHLSIQEIAMLIGYDDPGYFARQFRREFGQSPLSWRSASRTGGGGDPADNKSGK